MPNRNTHHRVLQGQLPCVGLFSMDIIIGWTILMLNPRPQGDGQDIFRWAAIRLYSIHWLVKITYIRSRDADYRPLIPLQLNLGLHRLHLLNFVSPCYELDYKLYMLVRWNPNGTTHGYWSHMSTRLTSLFSFIFLFSISFPILICNLTSIV